LCSQPLARSKVIDAAARTKVWPTAAPIRGALRTEEIAIRPELPPIATTAA